VTFVGGGLSDDALIEELRRASIYVSTSRGDTTSRSLLEAMSCGLPPVVTDTDLNREWITHENNGMLVSLTAPETLAAEVVKLLDDTELRVRYAERGRRLVRARGDWAKNMERARKLLVDLVSGEPG
jgi:glycosyltransferase involved in cell wall biosynthesis